MIKIYSTKQTLTFDGLVKYIDTSLVVTWDEKNHMWYTVGKSVIFLITDALNIKWLIFSFSFSPVNAMSLVQ